MGIDGVILDIDGCLLEGNNANLKKYSILSDMLLSLDAQGVRSILCSGRPASFVEMNSIMLGIMNPFIFEWSAGIQDAKSGTTAYHPAVDGDFIKYRNLIKSHITRHINNKYDCWIQPGKEIAITIFSKNINNIEYAYNELTEYITTLRIGHMFSIYNKSEYIDIRCNKINKSVGFYWYLDNYVGHTSSPKTWLAIGDSIDDCDLFDICSFSGAPKNADSFSATKASYCSPLEHIDGVIDILKFYFYD